MLIAPIDDKRTYEQIPAMIRAGRSPASVRELLAQIVPHPKRYMHLVDDAGSRETIVDWCRYAQFPVPQHLPDEVPVYRGVGGYSPEQAAEGWFWSPNMEVAAWFADHWAACGHPPAIIVCARIRRESIVYYSDEANMADVIFEETPREYTVIDDQDAIAQAALRYAEAHQPNSWDLTLRRRQLPEVDEAEAAEIERLYRLR